MLFSWYGRFIKTLAITFKAIFVQDESSYQLASRNGFTNIFLSADTRMERVLQVASNDEAVEHMDEIIAQKQVMVWGSIWPQDEPVLDEVLVSSPSQVVHIVAPHNVSQTYIRHLQTRYNALCYSEYMKGSPVPQVVLIDHIGSLNRLYQYGKIAYVGGGFGKSVHNLLEPAVYNIPVFFGPRHAKFLEAAELIRMEAGFSEASRPKLSQYILSALNQPGVKTTAREWMKSKSGEAEKIARYICE